MERTRAMKRKVNEDITFFVRLCVWKDRAEIGVTVVCRQPYRMEINYDD